VNLYAAFKTFLNLMAPDSTVMKDIVKVKEIRILPTVKRPLFPKDLWRQKQFPYSILARRLSLYKPASFNWLLSEMDEQGVQRFAWFDFR
jgi:hypothetical protein